MSSPPDDSRKRKSVTLFDETITDEERRATRSKLRKVQENIHHQTVEVSRQANNAIYDKVLFTREAVLDAENVTAIAHKLCQNVCQDLEVPRYDAHLLVAKLTQKCTAKGDNNNNNKYFDWASLGREAGVCFNAVPSRISFLAGALAAERKVRKVAERRLKAAPPAEDVKEISPEEVSKGDAAGGGGQAATSSNKVSANEKASSKLKARLRERCKEEAKATGNTSVSGVRFLFNPKSFTQTVENLMQFAFCIKKGEASIEVDETRGLLVENTQADASLETTQAVLSFTMADWRRLTAAHELREGDLPHRPTSRRTG